MIEVEPNVERDRFFRYSRIRYSSLGPMGLKKALEDVKKRFTGDTLMDEQGFWDLYNDLKSHNGWETAEILAFLDLCSFDDVS